MCCAGSGDLGFDDDSENVFLNAIETCSRGGSAQRTCEATQRYAPCSSTCPCRCFCAVAGCPARGAVTAAAALRALRRRGSATGRTGQPCAVPSLAKQRTDAEHEAAAWRARKRAGHNRAPWGKVRMMQAVLPCAHRSEGHASPQKACVGRDCLSNPAGICSAEQARIWKVTLTETVRAGPSRQEPELSAALVSPRVRERCETTRSAALPELRYEQE